MSTTRSREQPRPSTRTHAFFGADGQPVAWLSTSRVIHLLDGTPVAWIARNGDVHGFDGRCLGWLQDGILWDRVGCCALFSPHARGGPPKPPLKPEPPAVSFKNPPSRQPAESPCRRPRRRPKWADVADEGFFSSPPDDFRPIRIVRRTPRRR